MLAVRAFVDATGGMRAFSGFHMEIPDGRLHGVGTRFLLSELNGIKPAVIERVSARTVRR